MKKYNLVHKALVRTAFVLLLIPTLAMSQSIFESTKKLAEGGHAEAQAFLAFYYYTGDGVTKSISNSVKWNRRSAEQGNAKGQYGLGKAYATGEGVQIDDVEAVKWFRLSAVQGRAVAQDALGSMYYNGWGVPKNDLYALTWFMIAINLGYEVAPEQTMQLLSTLSNDQVSSAGWLAALCLATNYIDCPE